MKKFLVFIAFLLIFPLALFFVIQENAGSAAASETPSPLPVIGSLEKLKELMSQMEQENRDYGSDINKAAVPSNNEASQDTGDAVGPAGQDYSWTNVQVQGVDEADIVKTDGNYIYQVKNNRVIISKVYPPEAMKVLKSIRFNEGDVTPRELYVDDSFLVVIGSGTKLKHNNKMMSVPGMEVYPPYYEQYVKAVVYDIRDKNSIEQVRELELDGRYVASRKINSALYLVANKDIDRYRIMDGQADLPGYRNSAAGNKAIDMGLDKICYFPECSTPGYMLVAGLDLSQPEKKAHVASYLGSGDKIYVSPNALYTAVSQRKILQPLIKGGTGLLPEAPSSRKTTAIYKFSLDSGNAVYKASGKVPGTVLDQFSMDAYNGYLRVATTTGDMWRTDEGTSKNNVYVLDGTLKIAGKLENIAPGERIYSARFAGDRGYMVTFKNVDPFFVIDVSIPGAPKVLGALKIPGYSDYLHPVDDNHILGFGKDTAEEKDTGRKGEGTSIAYYQGMKLALFDVTNVSKPVEKFRTVIGDRGTDSPLLKDHKALLFDKSKGLLAFPITVTEVKGEGAGAADYGEFVFQGAYVYSFSVNNGFSLLGKITHLSGDDLIKSGYSWYGSDKNIARILYIHNVLYTVSNSLIKASDLQTLNQISQLALP